MTVCFRSGWFLLLNVSWERSSVNSWLEVKRTGGTDLLSTFTLTLTDPEVELTDDRSQLTFSNKNQPDLKQTVILVLHEAEVTDLAISERIAFFHIHGDGFGGQVQCRAACVLGRG